MPAERKQSPRRETSLGISGGKEAKLVVFADSELFLSKVEAAEKHIHGTEDSSDAEVEAQLKAANAVWLEGKAGKSTWEKKSSAIGWAM